MFNFYMVFRFIKSNIKQTLALIIMFVFGTFAFYFSLSASSTLEQKIVDNAKANLGHINITTNTSFNEELLDDLKKSSLNVKDVNFINTFTLRSKTGQKNFLVKSYDIHKYDEANILWSMDQKELNELPKEEFGFDDYDFEIVVGHKEIKTYTKTEDYENLIGRIIEFEQTHNGKNLKGKVTGILFNDVYSYSINFIYTPLVVSQELFDTTDYNTIEISLYLPLLSYDDEKEIVKVLNKHNLEYQIHNWQEGNEYLTNIIYVERIAILLIQIITAVAIAYGLSNMLSLIVKDKIKQIGILKALGNTSKKVELIFITKTIIITIISIILGLLFSFYFLKWFEITFTTYGFIPLLKFEDSIFNFYSMLTAIIIFVSGLIGTYIPVKNTRKVNIINIIKDN